MAIYGPQLVSCSALPTEFIIVRAGSDAYLIVSKAHQGEGFPRRELEIFTVAEVLANASGPHFFNVQPLRVEVLKENFFQVSAVTLSGNRIRFFYNTPAVSGGQRTIYRRDIDVETRRPLTERTELPFEGIDPFIVDTRTFLQPNRLLITYCDGDGRLLARETFDLAATWRREVVVEDDPPAVRLNEVNILDPLDEKDEFQVLMQRDNGDEPEDT